VNLGVTPVNRIAPWVWYEGLTCEFNIHPSRRQGGPVLYAGVATPTI
jgi:hypothetical protein